MSTFRYMLLSILAGLAPALIVDSLIKAIGYGLILGMGVLSLDALCDAIRLRLVV